MSFETSSSPGATWPSANSCQMFFFFFLISFLFGCDILACYISVIQSNTVTVAVVVCSTQFENIIIQYVFIRFYYLNN